MRKLLLFLIIVLITSLAQAQVKNNDATLYTPNNQFSEPVTYQFFATQNMWTFIKLNTRNGQMWQVQFDAKENNRGQSNLSLTSLVTSDNEKNGRFALFPTQNIYTFLLIDQTDGRVWQVQWSMDPEKRLVIPIR